MSNPFNPFQTRSVLRFPPGARKKLSRRWASFVPGVTESLGIVAKKHNFAV